MKKLTVICSIAVLLCAALVVCIATGYARKKAEDQRALEEASHSAHAAGGTHYIYKKPVALSDYVGAVRDSLWPYGDYPLYNNTGFERGELVGYEIGSPFSVFVFGKDGGLLSDETVMACPIEVKNAYKGKAVVEYIEDKNEVHFHKDTLIADIAGGTVDTTAVLTLGKVGSKTFVTDGVNLDILVVDDTPHPDDLTDSELKALAATFKAAAGETYHYICGYYITVQPIEQ